MEQSRFRCHYSIVFENMGRYFFVLFFFFLGQGDLLGDILSGEIEWSEVIWFVVVVVAVFLIAYLYQHIIWAKTWVSVEEDTIVIERRTLQRRINTIGIKSISNINLEQNLIERMLNTYTVKLDTNSRTTADQTDVKIVLERKKAEGFRDTIMSHMKNADGSEVLSTSVEEESFDVMYTPKDIVKHCLYTSRISSVIVIISVGLACLVSLRMLRKNVLDIANLASVLGGFITVFILFYSAIQSLIKDFFVYYDFRVKRQGDKIYLNHGLLKKRRYVLSVNKINAVEIVSPLVSRLCKRQYVKLICVGMGDEKEENSMLLLAETKEGLKEKLAILLPEFQIEQADIKRRSLKSIIPEIPGTMILFGLVIAFMVAFGTMDIFGFQNVWSEIAIFASGIFILLFSVLVLVMGLRTQGVGLLDDSLLLMNGIFQKKITWIAYSKVQQITFAQGPIRRKCGLANGSVSILARVVDSIHTIPYMEQMVFEQIGEKILTYRSTYQSME